MVVVGLTFRGTFLVQLFFQFFQFLLVQLILLLLFGTGVVLALKEKHVHVGGGLVLFNGGRHWFAVVPCLLSSTLLVVFLSFAFLWDSAPFVAILPATVPFLFTSC